MSDLIWVGNTLLPRGVVIFFAFLAFVTIMLVALAIRFIVMKIQYRRQGDM